MTQLNAIQGLKLIVGLLSLFLFGNLQAQICNGPEVVDLVLVQAGTTNSIQSLSNGDTINLQNTPDFNIEAIVCDPGSVGSVDFILNGQTEQLENIAPYAIGGDKSGVFKNWNPGVGAYTLQAIPYSSGNRNGTMGVSLTISFVIVDQSQTTPPKDCNGDAGGTAFLDDCGICVGGNTGKVANADKDSCGVCFGDGSSCANPSPGGCSANEVTHLRLINTTTGVTVRNLKSVDTINLQVLPNFAVSAEVCSEPDVESVEFFLDGQSIRMENIAPYAIAGDQGGSFNPWNPGIGNYTLIATPYSGNKGSGNQGISETVNLIIVNSSNPTPITDCNGDVNGTASVDNCGICSGGNTGIAPNSTCTDCNGVVNGTASIDTCGVCSGGNTGITPNNCGGGCVGNSVVALMLIDASTNVDLGPISNGDTIARNLLPNFAIRADVCQNSAVESLEFKLNGSTIRTENIAPYSINGDNNGSYSSWDPGNGSHTVNAIPYSGNNLGGTPGVAKSVTFFVWDGPLAPDCNGVAGGSAYIDGCGTCVGGNTGLSPCIPSAGCGEFIEVNGLVVVEVESEPKANSNWYEGSGTVNGLSVPSPSGTYYMWKANCVSGTSPNYSYSGCSGTDAGNDNNAMTYEILISTPGRYRFLMRSWQPAIQYSSNHGAGTENNDFWIQLPDGGGIKKKSSTEISIGTSEWVKVYQNNTNGWVWDTKTVDNSPHAIYIDFASPGIYRVKVAGRSKLMALDRFVLFRSGNPSNNVSQATATNLSQAESNRGPCPQTAGNSAGNPVDNMNPDLDLINSGSAGSLKSGEALDLSQEIKIYPNPTNGQITIEIPDNLKNSELHVFDALGRNVMTHKNIKSTMLLDLSGFSEGIYLIKIKSGEHVIDRRVIKR